MSHPNPTGNGCSLEDCLTNLFALTDLCGIKWRRLASDNLCVEALDDPVLVGFSRCISNDILCVWRRVQRDPEQRQPDFNCSKELWIFWYGDEPENLRQALPHDLGLKELESGTWDRDKDNGLTYECRTLLFKALHNLIERNLLMKNFVRLGQWYVLPYEHGTTETGVHLSFCFHYFLHGESQVCASIEVKLRPPVFRLTPHHLALVLDNQASIQVILAPNGLSGILTGVTCADTDHSNSSSAKMYAEWAGYFPIKESRDEGSKLPSMVEVIVSGTRMWYPSCYVLVCDNEDMAGTNSVLQPLPGSTLPPPAHHSRPLGRSMSQYHHMSPPASPMDPSLGMDPHHHSVKVTPLIGASFPGTGDNLPAVSNSMAEVLGYQIAEKVRQDACLNSALNKRLSDITNSSNSEDQPQPQWPLGVWNFTDPASKVVCNCVRHRKKILSKNALGGKHGKGEKLERPLSRVGRSSVPFHKRGAQVDDLLQFDIERIMTQTLQQPNPAFCPTGSTTIASSNSTSSTPQGHSTTPMHDNVLTLDTPNSAPSPLDEPQPFGGASTMDPTMPTLSPHPPSKFLTDGSGSNNRNNMSSNVNGTAGTGSGVASVGSGGSVINGGVSASGVDPVAPASASIGDNAGITNNNTNANSNIGGSNGAANTTNLPANPANNVIGTTVMTNSCVNGPSTPSMNGFCDVFVKTNNNSDENVIPAVSTSSQGAGGGGNSSVQTVGENLPFSWSSVTTKTESVSHWVQSHQQRPLNEKSSERHLDTGLKRPSLPTKGSESDLEQTVESLYDFDSLNMWIDMPLKKGRYEHLGDSLSGELLITPSSSLASHSRAMPMMRSPSPPEPDPYEFSEEASKDPKTHTTRSRPSRDDMARPSPLGKMDDDSRPSSRQGLPDVIFKEESSNDIGQMASPLTPGGSLTRELDLKVMGTAKDLQRIFQSDSSEEDDDGGGIDSGLSSKIVDDLKTTRIPNCTSIGNIAPLDLGRMYPTPPSHETNKSHSPETMTDGTNEGILAPAGGGSGVGGASSVVAYHSTVENASPPEVDPVTNVKCDVFVPSTMVESFGSTKYSQVDLPSGQMSPIPNIPDYKPSWGFNMPIMDSQHTPRTQYVNLPSVENISSIRTVGSSAGIDASPAIYNSSGQQRTPLSYELTSPASNSSSYLNKMNNSIDNHGTNSQLPEANSLLLNVLLSDSILNLYKDHNFDSCNICVCNADINGSDVSVYIPDTSSKGSSSGCKCTCAFSAAVNRRFGYDAGLFYEDEVEITGIRDDRYDHRKPLLTQYDLPSKRDGNNRDNFEDITPEVLSQLLGQYASPFLSCIGSHHLNLLKMSTTTTYQHSSIDHLQIRDANDAVCQALEIARQAMDHCLSIRCDDPVLRSTCLHKWPYLRGASCLPNNSQDILQCLKSLHPILQNAIQNKRVTRLWENTYKLQGPISWKDFHELAGRGVEENHEPQPIPQVLVGHDREWLTVSPYSLRYWDKQFLEPHGKMRDVLYLVVAPENDFILQHVTSFFKELSTVYEMCRLGRHCFINKLKDGILRVGKKVAANMVDEQVDEWFSHIGDSHVSSKLKLYAQVCKHILAPILRNTNLDKSLFDQGSSSSLKAQFKMPEPASYPSNNSSIRPATPDNQMNGNMNSTNPNHGVPGQEETKDQSDSNGQMPSKDSSQQEGSGEHHSGDDGTNSPGIVIYFVDPFSYGLEDAGGGIAMSRLSMVGLLKCFLQLMNLPDHLTNNLSLQLIPLRTVLEHGDSANKLQTLKSIVFSVFTSCKWSLSHNIMGRSLTGFGPAAAAEQILKKKEQEMLKLYSPPFVLAPTKSRMNQLTEVKCDNQIVLFFGYSLSEDQRWLVAVCTDERGELMEHTVINIEIPNRNRRKKASARKTALHKMWDFILSMVSLVSCPTRLVIGRLGRMGHGELKGWAGLLSKKNLQSATRKLKEMCVQCTVLGPTEVPCILSACLVSIETHPSFMIMVDTLKQDEKQSSQIPLQTPRDASVTHILVFPTSATAEVNANPLQQDPQNDFATHLELDDVFSDINQDDMNFFDIFDNFENPTTPPGSPGATNRQNQRMSGPSTSLTETLTADPQDEMNPNLLQQPLAMGLYISTAPPGPLPKWFWSACPENERANPCVFKSALHIHESSRHDDLLHKSDKTKPHALDSHMTCDVLRYVLENYNSLSWLTFDPVLNDRRSCLPVHMVVLMQLYHALNAFV